MARPDRKVPRFYFGGSHHSEGQSEEGSEEDRPSPSDGSSAVAVCHFLPLGADPRFGGWVQHGGGGGGGDATDVPTVER